MRNPIRYKLWKSRYFPLVAGLVFLAFIRIRCFPTYAVLTQKQSLSDVRLAIKKRDNRFVTVRGFTISVPGIPDGAQNGLVLVHGKKPPIGVEDYIRSESEGRQQDAASAYAQTYNTFLLKHLLDYPDSKTKSYLTKVRQELKSLEHANARIDALRSFKSSPKFLGVFGSRESGYPLDDSRTSHVEIRWLQMNASVLRGDERKLFDRIMKTYVIPYNQILYKQLKQKWEKQGIKDFAKL